MDKSLVIHDYKLAADQGDTVAQRNYARLLKHSADSPTFQ
jgi:hypothetical protein